MTPWSPMRIWSLVTAATIGIALGACTVTALAYHQTTLDHPLFWLGVVVDAVAAIANVGAYVRDHLADGQAEVLRQLADLREQVGDYGDRREVQGQAAIFTARASANGRHLGALPD